MIHSKKFYCYLAEKLIKNTAFCSKLSIAASQMKRSISRPKKSKVSTELADKQQKCLRVVFYLISKTTQKIS